jgi:hypothetical protein
MKPASTQTQPTCFPISTLDLWVSLSRAITVFFLAVGFSKTPDCRLAMIHPADTTDLEDLWFCEFYVIAPTPAA